MICRPYASFAQTAQPTSMPHRCPSASMEEPVTTVIPHSSHSAVICVRTCASALSARYTVAARPARMAFFVWFSPATYVHRGTDVSELMILSKPYLSVSWALTGFSLFLSVSDEIIHPDIYIITLCRVFVNHFLQTIAFSLFCTKSQQSSPITSVNL